MKKFPLLFLAAVLAIASLWASEAYFSPNGGIRDQIIKRIDRSRMNVDVVVYSFTSEEIAHALVDAHKRGVRVRVIRDRSQSGDKRDANAFLKQNGIAVQIRSGKGRGIMHDKFAVFDGKEIFTGSYNWTGNAEKNNYENGLFVDDPKIVQAYQKQFKTMWESPLKTR